MAKTMQKCEICGVESKALWMHKKTHKGNAGPERVVVPLKEQEVSAEIVDTGTGEQQLVCGHEEVACVDEVKCGVKHIRCGAHGEHFGIDCGKLCTA